MAAARVHRGDGDREDRTAAEEQEAAKKAAKSREKTAPKMGNIDIDYQVLHDAFFKWQNKPALCAHGDIYYEGKENETAMRDEAGRVGAELRQALGMPDDAPPPWLINVALRPAELVPEPPHPGLARRSPTARATVTTRAAGASRPSTSSASRCTVTSSASPTAPTAPPAPRPRPSTARWGEMAADEEEEEEDDDGGDDGDDDDGDDGVDARRHAAQSDYSGMTPARRRDELDGERHRPAQARGRARTTLRVLVGQLAAAAQACTKSSTRAEAGGARQGLFGSDKRYAVPDAAATSRSRSGAARRSGLDDDAMRHRCQSGRGAVGPRGAGRRQRRARAAQAQAPAREGQRGRQEVPLLSALFTAGVLRARAPWRGRRGSDRARARAPRPARARRARAARSLWTAAVARPAAHL